MTNFQALRPSTSFTQLVRSSMLKATNRYNTLHIRRITAYHDSRFAKLTDVYSSAYNTYQMRTVLGDAEVWCAWYDRDKSVENLESSIHTI